VVDAIQIELRILPGAPGWAAFKVQSGDRSVEIPMFSHALSDGFDDLVRATTCIVSGAWERTFSMDDEPEPRWQWLLKRNELWHPRRSGLEVTISRIDDVMVELGEEVFRTTCDADDFGRAVLEAMRAMMSSEAPESLRKRWEIFPVRAIAALEAALAVPPEWIVEGG
jgi:hypothetical protein